MKKKLYQKYMKTEQNRSEYSSNPYDNQRKAKVN